MAGSLTLLRGDQVHTLRLLVQGLRQLAVNLELIDNTFRQSRAVFRQQFGTFQRSLCFALTLTVELIAQSLQVSVELLTLLFCQFGAHTRQFLTVIGGKLCQLQFIDQGFKFGGFSLHRLILRGIAVGGTNAALKLIELAAGIGLLLRKLA